MLRRLKRAAVDGFSSTSTERLRELAPQRIELEFISPGRALNLQSPWLRPVHLWQGRCRSKSDARMGKPRCAASGAH